MESRYQSSQKVNQESLLQMQLSRGGSAQRLTGITMPPAKQSSGACGAYLLHRNWPFIASMEASDASKLS
jgi:hypothetical protein